MSPIDLPNMAACVDDARRALRDMSAGPATLRDYGQLLERLDQARPHVPRVYRRTMLRPFLAELKDLGEDEFRSILRRDPEGEGCLMLDIAQSLLQNAEGYEKVATGSFQEVVADLYDGFLSAEDRAEVKPPDHGVVAPLVKWGNPDAGPYTWPADATGEFGAGAGVVSLPPSHAHLGLVGWSALGHETAGHDILHADDGLLLELKKTVREALAAAELPDDLPAYWSSRIDETASDVLGILNMGPAAGAGVIAYFRGFSAGGRLSTVGAESDEHPADVLRGWLAAETVRLLSFKRSDLWADTLLRETDADAGGRPVRLGRTAVPGKVAVRSAAIVARTLVQAPLESLEGHALGQIQDWRDRDERIVAELRRHMRSDIDARRYKQKPGHYAAHAVAAAVYEGLLVEGAEPGQIMRRMQVVLSKMHKADPAWGPPFLGRGLGVRRLPAHGSR
ncbi:MAG TPA: hypothetical protein VMS88_06380 [Terriglobales bacterium]|nr:hypothetical protein [Terriglobales bacterium]